MTAINEPTGQSDAQNLRLSTGTSNDSHPMLARVDLVAFLFVSLGTALLGISALFFALIELVRLIGNLWTEPAWRWTIAIFAVALVWVALRWKRARM